MNKVAWLEEMEWWSCSCPLYMHSSNGPYVRWTWIKFGNRSYKKPLSLRIENSCEKFDHLCVAYRITSLPAAQKYRWRSKCNLTIYCSNLLYSTKSCNSKNTILHFKLAKTFLGAVGNISSETKETKRWSFLASRKSYFPVSMFSTPIFGLRPTYNAAWVSADSKNSKFCEQYVIMHVAFSHRTSTVVSLSISSGCPVAFHEAQGALSLYKTLSAM